MRISSGRRRSTAMTKQVVGYEPIVASYPFYKGSAEHPKIDKYGSDLDRTGNGTAYTFDKSCREMLW